MAGAPVVDGSMAAVSGAARVVEVGCQVQQCCHVVRLQSYMRSACNGTIMHSSEVHCNHAVAVTGHCHTVMLC